MSELPDPTIDLDWSGYLGSIQWHFSEVTKKYPDRTCVVETKSREASERKFTYRQIFEASNVVAHYLHDSGIANGDIIMIWAHRSVDLVVSIMGVLAAGSTVSILDPAYPPMRQKVYLEVAQPKAMINIAKATSEAGPLAPLVRSYIDEELQLKAEVSSLRLNDDGVLLGGECEGIDVFSQARTKSSSPPDILVGPDSTPTLSFTSGSEGRPKAVAGRHFSLTKYFGWMAERFHLGSHSRFTMLSGIAHDPIQRDIFTPLFLGAQLLIPAKEDIQHEKLAEWMREYKPTVTHLTPAMGQILVGGATAEFPSLDRAFFVGDVLTTRDCRHLRRLAANANIVNMYGTTETQRAVSYYELPSRSKDTSFLDKFKDVIPAGTGMKNVQLLIVDSEKKLCKVGEVGEIYVRAAGLAEGYKGDEALTSQKFLMNWFVANETWVEADRKCNNGEPWRKYYKGPRDRLYRTGDLGKYWESGDVECVGRVDDQIKIRGFRIELNDIDSNLSQNPLVRDCKTLVRRDRNEEPTLVSYIVPEFKEWPGWLKTWNLEDVDDEGTDFGPTKVYFRRFRRIQTEVRDHLKGRLPIYAVPTIFIVLNKLPLNPNGKVDKPNLPFPDIADRTQKTSDEDLKRWESMTKTERLVATKWADRIQGLDAKAILPENNFFDIGGHSMAAQQMLLDIRRELGTSVSIDMLFKHPSLAGFSAQVDRQLRSADANGIDTAAGHERETAGDYSQSLERLQEQLPSKFQSAELATVRASPDPTFFLTGATGFLGSYIIKDILERRSRRAKIIAHVRGVKDSKAAFDRLRRSLQGYGLWCDDWSTRLSCVVGDLSKPQLGIGQRTWQNLSEQVDVVIHNGAIVHWVRRYEDMMAANVNSTIEALRLCNEGKPKIFAFVSSTSVLDTDHYIKLSEQQISTGQNAISEEDDMQGSQTGLGTGYGQTKWVSEQLVRTAGNRGLLGSVIRPGYILGDSETGICNTDDFLIRMLKGCIQLSARPRIVNTVNSVPVNHVARVVVAAALSPFPSGVHVVHVTGHPRLRMNEYLSLLEYYGFYVPEVTYDAWKQQLENYVSAGSKEKDAEQLALMPLFHFCINDLPATTRAPELDDRNAVHILKQDAEYFTGIDESAGYGITREDVGRYLKFLVLTKFVTEPSSVRNGRPLPEIKLDVEQMQAVGAVGGRGGGSGPTQSSVSNGGRRQ